MAARVSASVLAEALATEARPLPCTYPGCGASFKSARGLRIHRTLAGHQRVKDSTEHGDGDVDRPGPRHPALRADPPSP